jgi:prolyl 4-hydroxylase
MSILSRIKHRVATFNYRRNYYLAKALPGKVPATPLHYLPDGFAVHSIAETGLKVVDNFCTQEEADYLINKARDQLNKSRVIEDGKPVDDQGRTSSHSVAFHRHHQDSRVLPIIARGAMLAGVPWDHAEQIYVSRYGDGDFYHGHYDFADSFLTDHRLCTMLIYLNDLNENEGGATYFKDLNIAVQPKMGRAIVWTNMNPDGSKHLETLHAALPPRGADTEKWVIQLWFRPYRMHPIRESLQPLQATPGVPLKSGAEMLPGTWVISDESA